MIKPEIYNQIKKKYGKSASWAVWAEEGKTPKSNISDLSIFNDDKVISILGLVDNNHLIGFISLFK